MFEPRLRKLTLQKCCACPEICAWPCESAAPATKSLLDLAKVRRLPRNLYLTLRKCCACHEICTWPCESDAPATNFALDLAKVLHLPRILHLTFRKWCACHAKVLHLPRNLHMTLWKCCACHEICAWPCESAAPATNFALDLAKVLRLPRNLHLTLRKCCACHETCTWPFESAAPATPFKPWENLTLRKRYACHKIWTWPCESAAPATQFKPGETFALPCQWARAPNALRTRSESGPRVVRPGAANRLASSSPETPIHARGHAFCRFLTPTTRARIFSRALIPSLVICLSESWLSISCRNTEVSFKLPLTKPCSVVNLRTSQPLHW